MKIPFIKSKSKSLEAQLISVLLPYAGERGDNEGAVEALQRIIRERDTPCADCQRRGPDYSDEIDALKHNTEILRKDVAALYRLARLQDIQNWITLASMILIALILHRIIRRVFGT